MRFTLYPIYWLSGAIDDEPFDLGKLPFDVVENVRIEAVSHQFRGDEFDLWKKNLGKDLVRELEGVEYALASTSLRTTAYRQPSDWRTSRRTTAH